MNGLPFIDEHSLQLSAPPTRAWPALLSVLSDIGRATPSALKHPWGLEPAVMRGEWRESVQPGDSLPGFRVAEARACEHLALEGAHRFSRYALVFELAQTDRGSILRALSWAEFPGVKGALYRAAVIGTRGHRLAVRRMLASVARRA